MGGTTFTEFQDAFVKIITLRQGERAIHVPGVEGASVKGEGLVGLDTQEKAGDQDNSDYGQ